MQQIRSCGIISLVFIASALVLFLSLFCGAGTSHYSIAEIDLAWAFRINSIDSIPRLQSCETPVDLRANEIYIRLWAEVSYEDYKTAPFAATKPGLLGIKDSIQQIRCFASLANNQELELRLTPANQEHNFFHWLNCAGQFINDSGTVYRGHSDFYESPWLHSFSGHKLSDYLADLNFADWEASQLHWFLIDTTAFPANGELLAQDFYTIIDN
ncbi:MAG: hypothetical protein AAF433_11540 [Bacteroidota bacterium]